MNRLPTAPPTEPPDPATTLAPPLDLALPPPAGPLGPRPRLVGREIDDQADANPERLVADVRDAVIAALEAYGPSLSSLRADETISVAVDFVAGGTPYNEFRTVVQRRLPGSTTSPIIVVTPRGATATAGFDVLVTVFWKPPSSTWEHRYQAAATVRMN